jgi:hypothetical protein
LHKFQPLFTTVLETNDFFFSVPKKEISLPVTILASTSQGTSEISCKYFKVLEHFEAKLGKNAVMP